ncbi:MAG: redox-regulated ATPase YchF [Desulfobacterales bacterium]|nr:redox-regulated ATPase YchF [Desulfobacterales bacterium]
MKLGIIGLSRSGKATVFEALTGTSATGAHRSEDRIGTVRVPDERVDRLSAMYDPKKTAYAQVEYFLPGNQGGKPDKDQLFWTAVRDSDALIHVVRNFGGYGFEPPQPVKDVAAMDQEMILADLAVVEKRIERIDQERRRGRKVSEEEHSLLLRCQERLEAEEPLRHDSELATASPLRGYAFVSAKPLLVLFNNEDEDDSQPDVGDLSEREDCMVVRAKLEQELGQMAEDEVAGFLEEFNVTASAMDRVIRRSYRLQGLISFFTVGDDEVKAWTIRRDTEAIEAAGVIHSDIKKGFIRAELVAYDDLMAAGTYVEARKRGTVRLEGKAYKMADGDIVNFRFNV